MTGLKEYDCVKVVKLLQPNRHFDGTVSVMRSPRVGDSGTIVHINSSDNVDTVYIVENVNSDGYTIWLADFTSDEIEACS